MNLGKSLFIVLAIVVVAPVASAAEEVWPDKSASELSIFATLLGFRIHADHCSARLPQLNPELEVLMEDLNSRVRRIAKDLLASDAFKDMKDQPVPAEIIGALKDSFSDTRHNFERRDAAAICPETLQNLGEMDDESLKSGLKETLTGIQNMIRNLEKDGAR